MSFNPQFAQIGEILVHNGVTTQQQVQEGLEKQKNFGTKLGETLLKLGYVEEKDLLKALHQQLEYPVILENQLLDLDPEVVKLIPEPFAVENRVIAIQEEDNAIGVAMTDPENIIIHDNLKKILGKPIVPYLIGESTLTDTLERYYKSIRTTSQVEDAVGNFEFVAVDEEENEITIDSKKNVDAPVVKLVNLIIMEAIKSMVLCGK